MNSQLLEGLNDHLSPAVDLLGGKVTGFDSDTGETNMSFEATPQLCHSETIVQGGYITGMLDATMAISVIGLKGIGTKVPTLELKVSFISPGNPGSFSAIARPVHMGKSIAFLAAELYQQDRLVATASSTVKYFSAPLREP